MKRILLLGAFICSFFVSQTEAQQRYLDPIFDDVTVTTNVLYGVNATVLALSQVGEAIPQPLLMDVYTPTNDSETNRHKKRASNEALSNIPLYYLFQCECILLS